MAFISVWSIHEVVAPKDDPLVTMGRRFSEQGLKIGLASERIRDALNQLPEGPARTTIQEQQRIIEAEAVALKAYGDALADSRKKQSSFEVISHAHAQSAVPANQKLTAEDVRLYGIVIILIVLGSAFIICIGIILLSDHARRLTFAIDTVKVLMGFFVGVATSFFSVGVH